MFEKYLLWIKKFTIFGLFVTLNIQKLEFWLLVNFGTHGKSVTRVLWKSFETRISENKNKKQNQTYRWPRPLFKLDTFWRLCHFSLLRKSFCPFIPKVWVHSFFDFHCTCIRSAMKRILWRHILHLTQLHFVSPHLLSPCIIAFIILKFYVVTCHTGIKTAHTVHVYAHICARYRGLSPLFLLKHTNKPWPLFRPFRFSNDQRKPNSFCGVHAMFPGLI